MPIAVPPTSSAPAFTPAPTLPAPAQPLKIPPEVETIILLGSDNFSPYKGRTDSILLVFLNRHNGSASLVSIPRDLYVYQPDAGMERINTAYVTGGVEMLYQTLEYNLGVRPRHWALAHLDDFIFFVEDLGGIEVYVTHPLPNDCGGIPEGLVHMDGYTALCYVRERKTSSDIHRSLRQQEVLRVIFQRFISLDTIPRLPEWYSRYSHSVRTDISLADLISFVPFALRLYDGGELHQYQIGFAEVTSWRVPENNAAVLLPDREKIHRLLQQAVDVLIPAVPTSPALETRIAELTASPTPTETPAPEPFSDISDAGTSLPTEEPAQPIYPFEPQEETETPTAPPEG